MVVRNSPGVKASRKSAILVVGTLAVASLVAAAWQFFIGKDDVNHTTTLALAMLGVVLGIITFSLKRRR